MSRSDEENDEMRNWRVAATMAVTMIMVAGGFLAWQYSERERSEEAHFEREETEFVVSNLSGEPIRLFNAGRNLEGASPVPAFNGERIWLPRGNYFLKVDQPARTSFYPVPIIGYRGGPEADGALAITVRPAPADAPPRLLADGAEFVYIPSGHFLLGDRLNPRAPHYVWLGGFFISPFEVTNAEFGEFVNDPNGYADESNWTEAGRRWRSLHSSRATALLKPTDAEFKRFGQPDQPVVWVTWYEANAFCRWLTKKIGMGKWLFGLPSEAEWEKAAQGPDGFDYALGMTVSDKEVPLYNWRKNPDVPVTVVGVRESHRAYIPNRYGLYHMSGNVVEWTQSVFRPYNRRRPYVEEERNRDDGDGQRVARGGSWYSASIARLYLPYRDAFQPEVRNHDLGFRVVARMLP
jgi:formylglycine-generating enzyme required for sulfatase activity